MIMAPQSDMAKGSCNPRTWHIVSASTWQLPEEMASLLIYVMIKSISIAFLYRCRDTKPANFEGIVLSCCVASADKTAKTCHLPLEFFAALFFKFVFLFSRTKTFAVAVFNYLAGKVRQQQVRFSGNTHASYVCWKFVYAMRIRTVRPRWRSYSQSPLLCVR